MGLINFGVAIAVMAGSCGLKVSAGDSPSPMPDLHADSLTYEHEAAHSGVPLAYERVEIPEARLALDVPTSWQQLDQEPAWSPTGDGEKRIGVSWYHLLPAIKPEAILLPSGGLIVESAPIALAWSGGRQYLVKDYGTGAASESARARALSVELHTIVTVVDGTTLWAYDLHAVAPTEEDLVTLKPVLDTMLRSMNLITSPPDQAPAVESGSGSGWFPFRGLLERIWVGWRKAPAAALEARRIRKSSLAFRREIDEYEITTPHDSRRGSTI